MTHQHTWPFMAKANPIATAIEGAGKLPAQERARILQPLQLSFSKLREGTGEYRDWAVLASAVNVAMAIELQGVVKGLREHLRSTELALQTINRRAGDDKGRFPYALHLEEIENLRTFVDLHSFQISELSRSEYREAMRYAVAEVRSTGGQALPASTMRQEGLLL